MRCFMRCKILAMVRRARFKVLAFECQTSKNLKTLDPVFACVHAYVSCDVRAGVRSCVMRDAHLPQTAFWRTFHGIAVAQLKRATEPEYKLSSFKVQTCEHMDAAFGSFSEGYSRCAHCLPLIKRGENLSMQQAHRHIEQPCVSALVFAGNLDARFPCNPGPCYRALKHLAHSLFQQGTPSPSRKGITLPQA